MLCFMMEFKSYFTSRNIYISFLTAFPRHLHNSTAPATKLLTWPLKSQSPLSQQPNSSPAKPPLSQMSIFDTSPQHCAEKQTISLHHIKRLSRKLVFTLSSLLLSLLFLFLLFFLILHPSKPRFHLRDATLYDLTLSSKPLPRLLNSTIQATIVSNNPNTHVGVYYDGLRSYAVYEGQQITAEAELPPFYLGNGDTTLFTASLAGVGMPVTTALGYEVVRDQMNGKIVLSVRLDGEMRWKVGSWVSKRYRFDVDCVAEIRYGGGGGVGGGGGGVMAGVVGSLDGVECSTNV